MEVMSSFAGLFDYEQVVDAIDERIFYGVENLNQAFDIEGNHIESIYVGINDEGFLLTVNTMVKRYDFTIVCVARLYNVVQMEVRK